MAESSPYWKALPPFAARVRDVKRLSLSSDATSAPPGSSSYSSRPTPTYAPRLGTTHLDTAADVLTAT
eukprot:615333-Prymnesium_polylepis.1